MSARRQYSRKRRLFKDMNSLENVITVKCFLNLMFLLSISHKQVTFRHRTEQDRKIIIIIIIMVIFKCYFSGELIALS